MTIDDGATAPGGIGRAELVALAGDGVHRFQALPAAESASTIGFAIPSTLRNAFFSLELDGASVRLPDLDTAAAPARSPLLEAEERALELATALSRAESDRVELEYKLRNAELDLQLAREELDEQPAPVLLLSPPEIVRAPAPSRSPLVVAGVVALALFALGLVAWPLSVLQSGGSAPPPAAPRLVSPVTAENARLSTLLDVPVAYVTLYRRAGSRYGLDWTWLAAVGHVETENGQTPLPGVHSGANSRGAIGPAQFLAGTWADFGLDGDGDGKRDPRDPADAIPAMASYLRASGAPRDWAGALLTYNHSQDYVDKVAATAAHYRRLRRTAGR